MQAILQISIIQEGNGKELRHLYDVATQHLCALRSMEYEPSGAFVTSALELKLDSVMMFMWQKHTQDANQVPHFGNC